jgi:hypothetical protein
VLGLALATRGMVASAPTMPLTSPDASTLNDVEEALEEAIEGITPTITGTESARFQLHDDVEPILSMQSFVERRFELEHQQPATRGAVSAFSETGNKASILLRVSYPREENRRSVWRRMKSDREDIVRAIRDGANWGDGVLIQDVSDNSPGITTVDKRGWMLVLIVEAEYLVAT